MIDKTVEVEAKANFQPVSYIKKIDHQIQQGNCSTYFIAAKVQTQGTTIKDLRIKEPKPKVQDLKRTNNSSDNVEISEKTRKKSKKRFQKEKCKQKNSSFGTFATKGNTNSNNIRPKGPKKDFFSIIY